MVLAALAILLSVVLVSLLSFLGIVFLALGERLLQRLLLFLVSFSVGALLGDVFIHMLPEVARGPGFTVATSLAVLAGFLFSFIVEKFIHWRHCHDTDCEVHAHEIKPLAILSLIGEAVHNFIDGVIIAASYLANVPLGLATTLAVVFHEIPHEMGNFALLIHGGFKRWRALLLNALTALTALLGAAAVLLLSSVSTIVTPYLLPFAAGTFLYIAGVDIIPELHKETKTTRNILQLVAILAGVGIMALMLLVA